MATVEIVTTAERHRKWSQADRERILAECDRPGAVIEHVARRNDVCVSLVHKWRKLRREHGTAPTLPAFVAYGAVADLLPARDIQSDDMPAAPTRAGVGGGFDDGCRPGGALEIVAPNGFRVAEAEFFRLRWSQTILDETERALAKLHHQRGDADGDARARKAIAAMTKAFPEAIVDDFAQLLANPLGLPDPNDEHVIAAAVKTRL